MASSNLGKRDLVPAIVWIILGILLFIGSYKLHIGCLRDPGPGMIFFFLGIILILLSLPIVVRSLRNIKNEKKKEKSIWAGVDLWKIGVTVVILFAYGFILEGIGFSVGTFCCLFFLFKIVGSEKVVKSLLLTSITVISAYLLFIIALKVQMPSFPWEIFF
jgi:hypothetical protein